MIVNFPIFFNIEGALLQPHISSLMSTSVFVINDFRIPE